MRKFFLPFALFACFASAYAQTPQLPKRNCASNELYLQQLKDDPEFARNQKQIELFTEEFIRKGGAASLDKTQAGTPIYTIPVVVHVVYKTTAQNITTAQVQSQIDVLNKDYQKLNADVSKVPSIWTSLVADCQIKFCLATIDPSGLTTTGIVRKSTTKTSFSTNNDVKFTSRGGDNAWPAGSYLNLWVCNLGGGILGYAQFPGGAASTDGVVIDNNAFGSTGTVSYPYNLGRTATHEIGHWLNLRHIWGDDGTACTGSDLVTDTPNQAGEHYGCPVFPQVTCSNGPNGDMFMNYMDYTDDRCMYMLTNGQKTRIYGVLQTGGARHSVTISGKCGPQPPFVSSGIITATNAKALLNVIPNPVVSGTPAVSYKLMAAANTQLTVSDIYGSFVKNINIGNQAAGTYQLHPAELGRLENGIYLLKLVSANGGILASTRFIVSK